MAFHAGAVTEDDVDDATHHRLNHPDLARFAMLNGLAAFRFFSQPDPSSYAAPPQPASA